MSTTTRSKNKAPLKNVGVIGLGVIGKPIAERLVGAGFRVHVYDVRDEPVIALSACGGIACTSSEDVAKHSEIIISLVFDYPQTEDVVFGPSGIVNAIKPGTIFATGSTLGPRPVCKIAEALAAKGCPTIDMPITGGFLAAREGKLVLMVGGDPVIIEHAMPVFNSFAHIVRHAGVIGAGQSAKLAHQLIMAVNILSLLEGLSLGVSGGVNPAILKQIIRDGIANSAVLDLWDDMGPRWKSMLERTAVGYPLPNLKKDLHTAVELAQELGVDLFMGRQALLVADAGVATGHDNGLL